jgi:hypothetical protein
VDEGNSVGKWSAGRLYVALFIGDVLKKMAVKNKYCTVERNLSKNGGGLR